MLGRQSFDRQFSDLRRRLNEFTNMFDTLGDPFSHDPFQSSRSIDMTTPILPLLSTLSPGSTALSTPSTVGGSNWLSPWTATTSDLNAPIVDLPLDVTETDKEMILNADVPGMDKSNFNIRISGDVLEIECHREEEKTRDEATNRIRERRYGRAIRSMRLPDNIDMQNISSQYVDGVLSLRLPKLKPEPSNVKRIEIQ
uniref:SHSP domain-containing protein n=1 Tax=Spongospora subterranea TaxID=70186 RepID=A0A0H5QPN7_9EUKA|eukprot:CRZ04008.1 hypothetical protein [Spongospora subterranea]